jgi:2-iminobutanoate/2-iminopropanoate deaminase
MAKKQAITSEKAPPVGGPYSQAILIGPFLFTSGQIAMKPGSGELVTGNIRDETIQVLENLKALVEEAGASMEDVVKTTIFLKDMSQFAEINEVYAAYFSGIPPARTRVEVSNLPRDVNVEIELVAYIQ